MTFLDLVNNVMRRLREVPVNTYTQSAYSTMVGDYVNDSLMLVQDAWEWTALRETIDITTVDGTNLYTLTDAGENPKIISAYNLTKKTPLSLQKQAYIDDQTIRNGSNSGSPRYFAFRGFDAGNAQIDVYPVPNAVETLRFNVAARQEPITSDGTIVKVPAWPIIHMAVALLVREKGEANNTSVVEYFSIAERHLADAISHDYMLTGGELDFDAAYHWTENNVY